MAALELVEDFDYEAFSESLTRSSPLSGIAREAFRLAASRFVFQLHRWGAQPHSRFVGRICATERVGREDTNSIKEILDLLQVAIDCADNIVDDDNLVGERYPTEILPTMACLPALLVGEVLLRLSEFPNGPRAARKLLKVLSDMAGGQSLSGSQKVTAVSGKQGLLLCIPFWLSSSEENPREKAIEKWARALGMTWELAVRAKEHESKASRAAHRMSSIRLVNAWPRQKPFLDGCSLSMAALFGENVFG